jgi:hypothetical protein
MVLSRPNFLGPGSSVEVLAVSEIVARLVPLLAQLDTSLREALDRMQGMDDAEFWWAPTPHAATVARDPRGWFRPVQPAGDAVATRTIAWLAGHLGDMAVLRTDYTTGDRRLTPGDLNWPGTAADGIRWVRESWTGWRAAITALSDAELDTVGRSAMPWGLDRQLPILDIIWWMNRELIHHAADIAVVRDLYHAQAR